MSTFSPVQPTHSRTLMMSSFRLLLSTNGLSNQACVMRKTHSIQYAGSLAAQSWT